MSLVVREMVEADVPSCAAVVDSLGFFQEYGLSGAEVDPLLRAALGTPERVLRVAEAEGAVQGFAWVVRRGGFDRSAYVRLIAVLDDARGAGVGRALMEALEAELLGDTDLILLVTETNAAARGFYERLGYRLVGVLPDYVQTGLEECIYFKPRRS